MSIRLLVIVVCAVWCTACRSTQIPAFFLPTQQHRLHLALPSRPKPEVLSRPALPARAVALPNPETRASLHTPRAAIADTARRVDRKKPKGNQPTQVVVGTDTLVGYPVSSRIPMTTAADSSAIPVDSETTFVNVLGGVLAAAGLVSLGVAAGYESEANTSWANIFMGLLALTFIPIGVVLLLYQGKNGRLRLRREARRQARTSTQAPATRGEASPNKKSKRNPLRKLAAALLIAGGLLLLAGVLTAPYGMLFFGLPGITALLIGLMVAIAGL
jgi:hypothetical protein